MSHPFEGWSAITEDWDSGQSPDVNEILGNIKTTARNFAGPVALAVGLLWTLKVLFTLFLGSLMIVAQVAEVPSLYTASSYLGYLAYPLLAVVSLVQMSLYRPLQLQAFEGREFVTGLKDVFSLSKEVVAKVAVATIFYGLANFVGALACLIGALIPFFFFSQAPYLAATTELSPWECMRRSYELTKAYFMLVLGAIVASLAVTAVLNGCGGVLANLLGGALMTFSPGAGVLVIGLAQDLFGVLSACALLVVSGGLFMTIQSAERSIPFKH